MVEVLRFKGEGGVRAPYSGLCPEAGGQGWEACAHRVAHQCPPPTPERVFPYPMPSPTPPLLDSLE